MSTTNRNQRLIEEIERLKKCFDQTWPGHMTRNSIVSEAAMLLFDNLTIVAALRAMDALRLIVNVYKTEQGGYVSGPWLKLLKEAVEQGEAALASSPPTDAKMGKGS